MSNEIVIGDGDVPQEVIQAIVDGRKVVAIKLLRESTGLGLANAKVIVDRLAIEHGAQRTYPDFSDSTGSSRLLPLAALLISAAVAWHFFSGGL